MSEYFTTFFAICFVTSKASQFKPSFPGINFVNFEYDESNNTTRTLYHQAIEVGCQAFVISDETFLSFLKDFHDVHDDCIQVFPNKHVVVYQSGIDGKSSEEFDKVWQASTAIDGVDFVKQTYQKAKL